VVLYVRHCPTDLTDLSGNSHYPIESIILLALVSELLQSPPAESRKEETQRLLPLNRFLLKR